MRNEGWREEVPLGRVRAWADRGGAHLELNILEGTKRWRSKEGRKDGRYEGKGNAIKGRESKCKEAEIER